MSQKLKIDFVSDVSCPWCVIGLRGLEIGLERVGDVVTPDITFHPYELNPNMPPEGENLIEHVGNKYGSSPDQIRENRASMKARADALGFAMNNTDQSRIWNTFDAHRLLHWAAIEGRQLELKHALFEAYFSAQRSPADREALIDAASTAGLDPVEARQVLESGRYGEDVRAEERHWLSQGVTGVPFIVINDKYLIQGGQPPEQFEKALRHIAAETSAQPEDA